MAAKAILDVVIVGAGYGGLICLHYAAKAKLTAVVLERQSTAGGLWAQLPAWQDIQVNRIDWTLGDLPIEGEDQRSILKNAQQWVDHFDLAHSIRLNEPVISADWQGDSWLVETPRGRLRARHLVAATGIHNRPRVPNPRRADASIAEYHSSALHDPSLITGKDVLVVGGGASAFDLLDLCFEHRARQVTWVYRNLRWMAPTTRPKRLAGGPRGLARQQMAGVPLAQISRAINDDLRARYAKFGLNDILPADDFDFRRHQLIPGRFRMIENFERIARHRGEVVSLGAQIAALSSGAQVPADLVLWGTGYDVDIRYFKRPALAAIRRPGELARRCGALFRSLDAPNLFFLAPSLLETTGATPWAYAHACRTIVAHIQGKAHLDEQPVGEKINHFDLASFLAERDPLNYPADAWRQQYQALAQSHPDLQALPIP